MQLFHILLLIILPLAIFGIGYGLWLRNRKKKIRANFPVPIPSRFDYIIDRPETPFIQSVAPVPESAAERIKRGIQKQIDCTPEDWRNFRNVADYSIVFINPMATNQDGSPALMVSGIQSAGTCIGVGNDGHTPPVIVLPHQADTDWRYLDYLQASARHEGEHISEWVNDEAVFYRFLGAGDIHPHFPDVNGN